MIALFQKGGLFMYGILGISIVAFSLLCERVNFLYFRLKLNADESFQRILLLLEKPNLRGALEECIKIEKHPMGRILKAGLLRSDKKDKDIERGMEEKILKEIPSIKEGINYMAMFTILSVLIGLLGTVVSLISVFNGAGEPGPAVQQTVLTPGLSQAMLTTAFGLVVAIPCLAGYFILNNRGNYIISQCKEKALGLFNALSSLKNSA